MSPTSATTSVWVCLLRLRSGALYVEPAEDVPRFIAKHWNGRGGDQTAFDPPVALVRLERFGTAERAGERAKAIRAWPSAKREALVAGGDRITVDGGSP